MHEHDANIAPADCDASAVADGGPDNRQRERSGGFVVRGLSSKGLPAFMVSFGGPRHFARSGFGRATEMASVWPTADAAKADHDTYLKHLRAQGPDRADEVERVSAYVVEPVADAALFLSHVRLVRVSS